MREKASRPRTGPCCPLAKREGDGSVETRSRTLPSSPSWDPEEKETALLLKFWVPGGQWRNRTKRKQKILHLALLRGKEWCGHYLLKSRIQRLRVARLRDATCPGASRAWQGRRRAAPVSCGQLHAAAVVQAAVVAELERRWRQQEGALGDEQTEGLPLRRIGRPGRSGSPGSGACWTPSYPPRSATGGAPGPLMWTSSDPGPAP